MQGAWGQVVAGHQGVGPLREDILGAVRIAEPRVEDLGRGSVRVDACLPGDGDERPQALDRAGLDAAHERELADTAERRVRWLDRWLLPPVPRPLGAVRPRL